MITDLNFEHYCIIAIQFVTFLIVFGIYNKIKRFEK